MMHYELEFFFPQKMEKQNKAKFFGYIYFEIYIEENL